MNDEIVIAIRARYLLRCTYQNVEVDFQPHLLGITTDHNLGTLVYKTGDSRGATRPGWRLFRIAGMRDLQTVPDRQFVPREDFNQHDLRFRKAIAHVFEPQS